VAQIKNFEEAETLETLETKLLKSLWLLDKILCILRIVEGMIIIRDFFAFPMVFYAKTD